MFQVDEYKVEFRYNEVLGEIWDDDDLWCTDCHIKMNDSEIASGSAVCHPKDHFNKNTGRKLSLQRALYKAGFERDLRKRFWDAYFTARNGKH